MEAGRHKLDEQIAQLNKILKKKNIVQVWQRTLQFYHNHQTTLNNYQIIKLIKVSFRGLKVILKSDIKSLNSLQTQIMNSSQKNLIDQKSRLTKIKDITQNLNIALKTFVSYTIVLQTFFQSTDQQFFTFIFKDRFQIHSQYEEIPFQPKNDTEQPNLSKQQLQHQLKNYLSLFMRFQLLFLQICQSLGKTQSVYKIINEIQKFVYMMNQTSYLFCFKKIEFDLLKMKSINNVDTLQKSTHKKQIQFLFPIECFHMLQQLQNKKSSEIPYYVKIMLRYTMQMINNIEIVKVKQNRSIIIQYLILIDQLIYFTKQIKMLNVNDLLILQYIKNMQKVFIKIVTSYSQINKIVYTYFPSIITNRNNLLIQNRVNNNKEDKNDDKLQADVKQVKRSPHRSIALSAPIQMQNQNIVQSIFDSYIKGVNKKCKKQILDKLQWNFNIIAESDSDENGQMTHNFEYNRRIQLKLNEDRLQKKAKKMKLKKTNSQIEQNVQNRIKEEYIIEYSQMKKKLRSLSQNIKEMKHQQKLALRNLRKYNESLNQVHRISSMDKMKLKKCPKSNLTKKQTTIPKIQNKQIHKKQKNKYLRLTTQNKGKQLRQTKNSPLMFDFKERFSALSQQLLLSNTYIHTNNL